MVPRLLCLIGSGETSPSMVSLHAELMERAGSPPAPAVMLDTSYGFQENADEISARALSYFRVRVGRPLEIASFRGETADPLSLERAANQLRDAAFIFAGPGSPSYTVRHLRGTPLPGLIGDRLARGGCVSFASAAAISLGRVALPVYEIYKVGQPPHWLEGLDLLAPLGLDVAVIPHYDNSEGGTHDTRYCYMGERRLRELERQLPDGIGILGVAEHTAAVIDFEAGTLEVRGRGFAAVRSGGAERRIESGSTVRLYQLGLRPRRGPEIGSGASPLHRSAASGNGGRSSAAARPSPLEAAEACRQVFEQALERGRLELALTSLLELDERLASEGGPDREGTHLRARSIYRGMLVRLGEAGGARQQPEQVVAPLIELALRLRDEARRDRRYGEADLVRAALSDLKVEVRDTPAGPEWSLPARG